MVKPKRFEPEQPGNYGGTSQWRYPASPRAGREVAKTVISASVVAALILTTVGLVALATMPACQGEYDRGFAAGFELGIIQGNETGWHDGNETGWHEAAGITNETAWHEGNASGWAEGNVSGFNFGWLAGNSSGFSSGFVDGWNAGWFDGNLTGWSDGWDAGYALGVIDGYALWPSENFVRFVGHSSSDLEVYSTDHDHDATYSSSYLNLNQSSVISISRYANTSVSGNMTIYNITLAAGSVIQDTFANDNSQAAYTASTTLTLYQKITFAYETSLMSITYDGLHGSNARPRVSLWACNAGYYPGAFIATLNSSTVNEVNGLHFATLTFNRTVAAGDYFVGLNTTQGTIRMCTSQGSGVNVLPSYYGATLAGVDYCWNFTTAAPYYNQSAHFIKYGILNALSPTGKVYFAFGNHTGNGTIGYYAMQDTTLNIGTEWLWGSVTFNASLNLTFQYDEGWVLNTTLSIGSLAIRNNQSTNFWGSADEYGAIDCDITYYTSSDISLSNFGVTINGYSFRWDLPSFTLQRGSTYYMNVLSMNATIYAESGTTWVTSFQMSYEVNGTLGYTAVDPLYLFEVFR